MGKCEKGIVLTLEGMRDRNGNYSKAKVQATTAEGTSTLPLTIPWYLRGSMGKLEKGTEVVYAIFDDETGVILSRVDGEWEGKLEEKELVIDTMGETARIEGNVDVTEELSGERVISCGVMLSSHQHKNVVGGSEDTDIPNGGKR